ncbi:hypothetical protein BT63DRAFT_455460 [Microthyrium microscopicum]|uniref:Protein FAF1 n=1 Tax=Microthyrium microscopicum TaxID=703497 RepID=A0A6A6UC65_9PEZI|nr:hypothetical protein BT63DRAFT_455460 [Microthyrium microscopicum]
MTVTLGKRKRTQPKSTIKSTKSTDSDDESQHVQDVFRKHFEAQFKPLPTEENTAQSQEDLRSDASSDSDSWSGFSEDENTIEVVEHTNDRPARSDVLDKHELKAFLSSKPPPSSTTNTTKPFKSIAPTPPADDEDSTANLKNDLALQRLLSESHLLTNTSSTPLQASGKARLKALDLRFQSLGSKESLYKQKMPMVARKGMVKKAAEREYKRRSEAKEAGIVLERVVKKKPLGGMLGGKKKDKGVGGPGVGKFRGGTLSLSRQDVADIQGMKGHGPFQKKRR